MHDEALSPSGVHGQNIELSTGRDAGQDKREAEVTVEAVVEVIVAAAGNAGADKAALTRLRGLLTSGQDALLRTPAELGIDSLTWLEVLTVLEETYDVLLLDAVATTPQSRTVLGLARALTQCLSERSNRLSPEK
ncbi:hypothetical protein [Streptomyces sp. NPDC086787]|uniref:hypothetical protein n=1 Tax=Streptomyces sp. NPDC086787 TaxID=3365759 RepID=UPI00381BA79A